MRLSANADSPHFYETAIGNLGGDPHSLSILVDGEKISTSMAVEADDADGSNDGVAPHEKTVRFSENYSSGLDGAAP